MKIYLLNLNQISSILILLHNTHLPYHDLLEKPNLFSVTEHLIVYFLKSTLVEHNIKLICSDFDHLPIKLPRITRANMSDYSEDSNNISKNYGHLQVHVFNFSISFPFNCSRKINRLKRRHIPAVLCMMPNCNFRSVGYSIHILLKIWL